VSNFLRNFIARLKAYSQGATRQYKKQLKRLDIGNLKMHGKNIAGNRCSWCSVSVYQAKISMFYYYS
jgi:hypothetical protein